MRKITTVIDHWQIYTIGEHFGYSHEELDEMTDGEIAEMLDRAIDDLEPRKH